jgi:hypothetical protein
MKTHHASKVKAFVTLMTLSEDHFFNFIRTEIAYTPDTKDNWPLAVFRSRKYNRFSSVGNVVFADVHARVFSSGSVFEAASYHTTVAVFVALLFAPPSTTASKPLATLYIHGAVSYVPYVPIRINQ